MYVFIQLRIASQFGPVILITVILCYRTGIILVLRRVVKGSMKLVAKTSNNGQTRQTGHSLSTFVTSALSALRFSLSLCFLDVL